MDIITAPYDAFNWVTDQVFLFMNALFDRYGIPIVFLAALAEATVFIGVVFPGVVLVFLGGAYAGSLGVPAPLVVLIAATGTMIGDTLSYGLGRRGGERLRSSRLGPSLRIGESVLRGRARWLIPFYHLSNVTRAVGPFGAGALRMPLKIWVPLDYLGAMISAVVWVGAGAIFGRTILTDDGTLQQHPVLRVGLIVLAALWLLLVQRELLRSIERQRAEELALDEQPAEVPVGSSEE